MPWIRSLVLILAFSTLASISLSVPAPPGVITTRKSLSAASAAGDG